MCKQQLTYKMESYIFNVHTCFNQINQMLPCNMVLFTNFLLLNFFITLRTEYLNCSIALFSILSNIHFSLYTFFLSPHSYHIALLLCVFFIKLYNIIDVTPFAAKIELLSITRLLTAIYRLHPCDVHSEHISS